MGIPNVTDLQYLAVNTLDEFHRSVASEERPPADLTTALRSLWWDAKGDWDRAHEATQAGADANVSWVHAYLHRKTASKKGDLSNAGYWYSRAGKPVAEGGLDAERDAIIRAIMNEV
jgi:hypothetical protein